MQIFVKSLTGKTYPIDCEPSSAIHEIKNQLSSLCDNPPEALKLIFAGRQLEDGRTLNDYNIKNEATVHLVIRANYTKESESEVDASKGPPAPIATAADKTKKSVLKSAGASLVDIPAQEQSLDDEMQVVDVNSAVTSIQKIARGRAGRRAAAKKKIEIQLGDRPQQTKKSLIPPTPLAGESSAIQAALQQGGKEWGRSRIMIVGEGRAGKTALSNSLIGKPYQATESTVGINQLICDVHYASGGKGGWNPYQKPEKELEAAVASMVAEQNKNGNYCVNNSADDSVVPVVAKQYSSDDYVDIVSSSVVTEVDEELVMKCLASSIETVSDLVVSVFDYGGQSVFNVIHHLFLTQNGVYVLAFNMEWLLSDGEEKAQCLAYLQFWTNSIYVHTYNAETNTAAPVVMVGTRKDRVSSPKDHERISTTIYETFSYSKIWPSILENVYASGADGSMTMWFYPVDNILGRNDPTVQQLMSTVEAAMNANAFTRKKVPLPWLQVVDEMQARQKPCLSLDEVYDIACKKCGIVRDHVPYLLHFLHEMGIALWHDEAGLRDVVILDAVAYFVTPATRVICKHVPDASNGICHVMDVHRECSRQHFNEWVQLTSKGVLDEVLLDILWKDVSNDRDTLLKLMIKFGLLVPLSSISVNQETTGKAFIVPALLPKVDLSLAEMREWTNELYQTCFFVFTSHIQLAKNSVLLQEDICRDGFFPTGLFERIIGKTIAWCLATTKAGKFNIRNITLHKELAILSFGSQRFRLMLCPKINSIRVDIEGKNPLVIQGRLYDLMRDVMNECMRSLECFPALLYSANQSSNSATTGIPESEIQSFCFSENSSTMLLPLESIRNAAESQSVLMRPGGRKLMSDIEAKRLYEPWLQVYGRRDHYDVFISYRWGEFDGNFVSALFDMFSNFTFGQDNRFVEVFLDKKRLQEGRRFDADFAVALTRSVVVVPIVSNDSLQKMLTHDPASVDNMLLEWIMCMQCYTNPSCATKAVFPFAFGSRRYNESNEVIVDSIFSGDLLNSLPSIVPTATLERGAKFLKDNNVTITDTTAYNSLTVHDIVNELMKFMCFQSWSYDPAIVVENGAEKILDVLRASQPDPQQQQQVSNGVNRGGGADGCDAIWALLHDEKCVTDMSAMRAKLDDIGIVSSADVVELDAELADQIGEFLKPIQCKKFKRMIASVLYAV